MFSKQTYISRRERLKTLVKDGIIVFFGNNESPVNYPNNAYHPFRQDSSFIYYFGQHRDGLAGVIDLDANKEWLLGDDIDIDDIVWCGVVDSVKDMAEQVGVANTAPMAELANICTEAKRLGRKVHFLPPYRFDTKIQIMDLLGIHPSQQKDAASVELILAVVKMRAIKEQQEIEAIEKACEIGYKMHTTAMRLAKAGVTERFVAGQVDGIAKSHSMMPSFATIFTQHGEIMHGSPSSALLENGRLALCDCGCELDDYCSDHTRTFPVSGKFTQKQLDIYRIVEKCHDYALTISKPGAKWIDVHMGVCGVMVDGLKEVGLMKGDTADILDAGAHTLFLPHGLGHMMGMDVHDMEGLGQIYVGFDDEVRPSTKFGTSNLRMGRRLEEGYVMTDEPGVYFIPALIDDWKSRGMCKDFINYDLLESYRDFGGIRIEDDILITADGCRYLGESRIPYHPEELEKYLEENR